jgi:hypothetical protein
VGSGRLGCCLEAVALYSGPYLAEGRHLDWIEERSQALQRQLIGVALEAGSALLVERRWLESAELSVRVVAEDPYHEGAYRLLIQALLAAGDTSGARRAFDELTRRLRQDLGVEPPPELASLVSAAHLYEAAVDSRHRGPRAVRIYSDLRLAKSRGQGVSLARVHFLIFGAGVLGSVYAARLREAGHEVTVLARGERLAELRRDGIVLEEGRTGARSVTPIRSSSSSGRMTCTTRSSSWSARTSWPVPFGPSP